jgi:hypothetical protein
MRLARDPNYCAGSRRLTMLNCVGKHFGHDLGEGKHVVRGQDTAGIKLFDDLDVFGDGQPQVSTDGHQIGLQIYAARLGGRGQKPMKLRHIFDLHADGFQQKEPLRWQGPARSDGSIWRS